VQQSLRNRPNNSFRLMLQAVAAEGKDPAICGGARQFRATQNSRTIKDTEYHEGSPSCTSRPLWLTVLCLTQCRPGARNRKQFLLLRNLHPCTAGCNTSRLLGERKGRAGVRTSLISLVPCEISFDSELLSVKKTGPHPPAGLSGFGTVFKFGRGPFGPVTLFVACVFCPAPGLLPAEFGLR
jgi:hypothetical protein